MMAVVAIENFPLQDLNQLKEETKNGHVNFNRAIRCKEGNCSAYSASCRNVRSPNG